MTTSTGAITPAARMPRFVRPDMCNVAARTAAMDAAAIVLCDLLEETLTSIETSRATKSAGRANPKAGASDGKAFVSAAPPEAPANVPESQEP